jgi:hypothetical protein
VLDRAAIGRSVDRGGEDAIEPEDATPVVIVLVVATAAGISISTSTQPCARLP